jgi:hypothetical protein
VNAPRKAKSKATTLAAIAAVVPSITPELWRRTLRVDQVTCSSCSTTSRRRSVHRKCRRRGCIGSGLSEPSIHPVVGGAGGRGGAGGIRTPAGRVSIRLPSRCSRCLRTPPGDSSGISAPAIKRRDERRHIGGNKTHPLSVAERRDSPNGPQRGLRPAVHEARHRHASSAVQHERSSPACTRQQGAGYQTPHT